MTFLNCVTYANATLYKYGTRIALSLWADWADILQSPGAEHP
jgi:hypothetical protein